MSNAMRFFLSVCEAFSILALFVVLSTFGVAFHIGPEVEVATVAIYVCLALGTDIIAVGHIAIVNQSPDGRAPIWLVVFTYSKLFQSIAYTGITLFVVARLLGWELPFGGELATGLVSCAAAGAVITAAMFAALWWSHLGFDYRVRPWPWQVIRDMVGGYEPPPREQTQKEMTTEIRDSMRDQRRDALQDRPEEQEDREQGRTHRKPEDNES